jgi:hypothetical protein
VPGQLTDPRRRSGEQDAHRRAFGEAVERRTPRTDRVHHRPHVVHPHLERGRTGDRIRHRGAALVKADKSTERREIGQEVLNTGQLPLPGDARSPAA